MRHNIQQNAKMRGNMAMEEQATPKKSLLRKLNDIIEKQLDTNLPNLEIHMIENKQVVLEGINGIIEYSHNTVRLSDGKRIVCITGQELMLCGLSTGRVVVEGIVSGVELM